MIQYYKYDSMKRKQLIKVKTNDSVSNSACNQNKKFRSTFPLNLQCTPASLDVEPVSFAYASFKPVIGDTVV